MPNNIINGSVIAPRNTKYYRAFRGVTDFTNINQFAQYETGYQLLSILQMPKFMEKLDEVNGDALCESFRHMLEYEFKGLDGLPDVTSDTMEITDGINTQRLINKVTYDTSTTVSMSYFEKTGGLITKFAESYLTGIKDKLSQAKTYHGLIREGKILDPGPDKEIFTMLYIVTDNTMLRVERGVLLANCQLTKAETSMYNGNKGDINNKEMTIEFNCYPIMNNLVDKAAKAVLDKINNVKVTYTNNGGVGNTLTSIDAGDQNTATQWLDSTNYKYGIFHKKNDITYYNANKGRGRMNDVIDNPTGDGNTFKNAVN